MWPGLERLEAFGRHLAGAAVGLELVGDLLALVEGAQARTLDRADVHERVLTAAIGGDEAEALGRVEPLHGSRRHGRPFLA